MSTQCFCPKSRKNAAFRIENGPVGRGVAASIADGIEQSGAVACTTKPEAGGISPASRINSFVGDLL